MPVTNDGLRAVIGGQSECRESAWASVRSWFLSDRRWRPAIRDRKSTRLNSSHGYISYAVFCFKKKKTGGRVQLWLVYPGTLHRGAEAVHLGPPLLLGSEEREPLHCVQHDARVWAQRVKGVHRR